MNFGDMQRSLDEALEVLDSFEELNMMDLEFEDQLKIIGAVTAYADILKPIVAKYSPKLPKPQIFFARLDDFMDD